MADEQPNTPSAEPERSSEPASAEPAQSASESPSWWSKLFHRRGDAEPEADQPEPAASAPSVVQLTQDELDRRIQAETDRREAKRAAEWRSRQKKELRDSDPWQYAEQERLEEQQQSTQFELSNFLANVGKEHDKVSVDVIFLALPQAEQERILKIEGAGQGLAGRKLVVEETLKALERHWKAEGEKAAENKLRRNQAFRKQLLAEARGQTTEPDLLPPISSSESDKTVSGLLRKHYNLG